MGMRVVMQKNGNLQCCVVCVCVRERVWLDRVAARRLHHWDWQRVPCCATVSLTSGWQPYNSDVRRVGLVVSRAHLRLLRKSLGGYPHISTAKRNVRACVVLAFGSRTRASESSSSPQTCAHRCCCVAMCLRCAAVLLTRLMCAAVQLMRLMCAAVQLMLLGGGGRGMLT